MRYLGQYTHRIAISNQRILNVDSTHVTFVAKDYRNRAQKKPVPWVALPKTSKTDNKSIKEDCSSTELGSRFSGQAVPTAHIL
nr:transposase [Geofilum rubicundum]